MGHLTFPQLRLPPKVNTPTQMGQCGNEAPIQARFDMPVPVQGDATAMSGRLRQFAALSRRLRHSASAMTRDKGDSPLPIPIL